MNDRITSTQKLYWFVILSHIFCSAALADTIYVDQDAAVDDDGMGVNRKTIEGGSEGEAQCYAFLREPCSPSK